MGVINYLLILQVGASISSVPKGPVGLIGKKGPLFLWMWWPIKNGFKFFFLKSTLPETTENRPSPKRAGSSSNHPFSGVNSLLVSGRVLLFLGEGSNLTFFFNWIEDWTHHLRSWCVGSKLSTLIWSPTFGTRKVHWEDGSDPMCPKVRNRCFTTQARLVVELVLVTQIRTQFCWLLVYLFFCLIEI